MPAIDDAMRWATLAVGWDQGRRYDRALVAYDEAAGACLRALRDDSLDEETRAAVRAKANEYRNRAELLRSHAGSVDVSRPARAPLLDVDAFEFDNPLDVTVTDQVVATALASFAHLRSSGVLDAVVRSAALAVELCRIVDARLGISAAVGDALRRWLPFGSDGSGSSGSSSRNRRITAEFVAGSPAAHYADPAPSPVEQPHDPPPASVAPGLMSWSSSSSSSARTSWAEAATPPHSAGATAWR